MGIPLFFSYIRRFTNAVVARPKGREANGRPLFVTSSLAYDLNGGIHKVWKSLSEKYRKRYFDQGKNPTVIDDFYLAVCEAVIVDIMDGVNEFHPVDTLIVVIDGVPVMGKMFHQAGSRARKAIKKALSGIVDIDPFDSNSITPGTPFMFKLDSEIRKFLSTTSNLTKLPPHIFYSSHMEPGEGEHKIMDIYRKGLVTDQPGRGSSYERLGDRRGMQHLLVGKDADLILLALVSPVTNIVVVRDDDAFAVDVNFLKLGLTRQNPRPSIIEDFLFIACLIGNDFLPSLTAFQNVSDSLNLLMKTLDLFIGPLVNPDLSLNLTGINRFFELLAGSEVRLLDDQRTLRVRMTMEDQTIIEQPPPRFVRAAVGPQTNSFKYDAFRDYWYSNAIGGFDVTGAIDFNGWRAALGLGPGPSIIAPDLATDQPAKITPVPFNDVDVDRVITRYLTTIQWVLLYYYRGIDAVNFDWINSYYYAPLLSDLTRYTSQNLSSKSNGVLLVNPGESPGLTFSFMNDAAAYPGMRPLTPLHQLVAVMPRSSINLVPQQLHRLYNPDSPIYDLHPETAKIDLDGKVVEHAGIVLMPPISRARIEQAVAGIPLEATFLVRFIPDTTTYYGLTTYDILKLGSRYQFTIPSNVGQISRDIQAGRARVEKQPVARIFTEEAPPIAVFNTNFNTSRASLALTASEWNPITTAELLGEDDASLARESEQSSRGRGRGQGEYRGGRGSYESRPRGGYEPRGHSEYRGRGAFDNTRGRGVYEGRSARGQSEYRGRDNYEPRGRGGSDARPRDRGGSDARPRDRDQIQDRSVGRDNRDNRRANDRPREPRAPRPAISTGSNSSLPTLPALLNPGSGLNPLVGSSSTTLPPLAQSSTTLPPLVASLPPLTQSSTTLPPLVPSLPPLAQSSTTLPPLVPSLPPLAQSSTTLPPLMPSLPPLAPLAPLR